jgi:hypothetical protein
MPLLDWNTIEPYMQWLGFISLLTFIGSLAMLPWLISHLPYDYFVRKRTSRKFVLGNTTFVSVLWFTTRNIAGILVLLAGIAMLFLPGQGILTIILGIAIMSFPGKYRLLFAITARPSVQRSLNWLRKKTRHPEFIWPS